MTTTIAGIAGSLRRGSVNRLLLQAAGHELPPGARLAVFELLDRAVAELRRLIAAAGGLLIATPEYNGSCGVSELGHSS